MSHISGNEWNIDIWVGDFVPRQGGGLGGNYVPPRKLIDFLFHIIYDNNSNTILSNNPNPILKTSLLVYTLVILAILYSNQNMSSSNTIVESVVVESVVAAPVPAKVVQRKKKTVPVIAKHEESTDVEPTITETLIDIMQTKPIIQVPKHKKKNVTVADIVAPKIPKQNKKKNIESAPETQRQVDESVAENALEVATVVPIEVAVEGPAPKVVKKRAPKKKVEAPVVPIVETNMDNIERLFENMTIAEESVAENALEQPITVVAEAPAPKVVKKRAPKKKVEAPVVPIVETNMDNIESLFENMAIAEESVPQNALEQPIEVAVEAPAPKVVKKRAPKKKVEAPVVPIVETNMDNIESLFENMTIAEESVPQNALEQPIEVAVEAPAPKVVKKRAPKKKVEAPVVPIVETNMDNIESLFENMAIAEESVLQNALEQPIEVVAEAPAPKVVKKRAPKKKVEAPVVPIVDPNMDNIESHANITENTLEIATVVPTVVAEAPAPKVVKKRAPKKKVEAPVVPIVETNMDNIESLFENMTIAEESVPQNALEQPITVVAEAPAPKVAKKRAPKKKVEAPVVPIVETIIENIESLPETQIQVDEPIIENIENHEETICLPVSFDGVLAISNNNDNEPNGMEWFDEQAKQIALRREPILATFAETPQELVEELYEATLTQHTHHHQNTHIDHAEPYGNLQPIADIISQTLENEDEYTEQIMVETFEINGKMYWIDAENRLLDYETFEHIANYEEGGNCSIPEASTKEMRR